MSLKGHSGDPGEPFGLILGALGVVREALVDRLDSFREPWGSLGKPWWTVWAHFGSFGGHAWSLRSNFSSLGPKIASITKTLFFLRLFNDFEGVGSRC